MVDSCPSKMLTVHQVALELGVSSATVRRLIHGQSLRGVNVGAAGRPHWRVRPVDLEAFLNGRGSIDLSAEDLAEAVAELMAEAGTDWTAGETAAGPT